MMFLLRLAKDLGQTLETIMNLSTVELELWMAFYKIEYDERKRAEQKARSKRR